MEQTLTTDQDNGLVFSAADDGEARDLRELFLPFTRAVNQALAECGFPLCDGEVMAGNPRWCLSIAEWQTNFGAWVRTPEPEALLNAAIFFDFRALAGDAALAREYARRARRTHARQCDLPPHDDRLRARGTAAAGPVARLCRRAGSGRQHRPEGVRFAHLRRCRAHPCARSRLRRNRNRSTGCVPWRAQV